MLDAGGSLLVRDARPGSPAWPQAVIKAELVAEALAAGGLDAMAVGGADWLLGLPKVLALREAHGLPILAANLVCSGSRPFPSSRMLEAGGLKVGVVGFTSGTVEGCVVEPVEEAAARAVAEVAGADVVVALAPVEQASIHALPRAAPAIHFVIDGRSGRRFDDPDTAAGAWWLAHGHRGQNLGVVGLRPMVGADGWVPSDRAGALARERDTLIARRDAAAAEAERGGAPRRVERAQEQVAWYAEKIAEVEAEQGALTSGRAGSLFTWKIVPLDAQVPDHPATAALVAAGKARIATAEAPSEPLVIGPRVVADGPFAGSEACAACHPSETAQWAATGHARAWAGLSASDRALDRQCVGCHVTGWGADGGPESPVAAAPFRDVQCEACHGPSRAHLAAPATVRPIRTPLAEVCTGCHDGVQDQGRFDQDAYWPRVVHDAP